MPPICLFSFSASAAMATSLINLDQSDAIRVFLTRPSLASAEREDELDHVNSMSTTCRHDNFVLWSHDPENNDLHLLHFEHLNLNFFPSLCSFKRTKPCPHC